MTNVNNSGIKSKILNWVYDKMTLNIYIRLFIEAFLLMIVSSLKELYLVSQLNSSQGFASYFMNLCIIFLWGSFIAIWIWQWLKSRNDSEYSKQYYFNEFFLGTKNNWIWRIYHTLFLTKRVLLVVLVILFEVFPMILKVVIFILIQLSSCATIWFLKPFHELKDNIIEITNEVFFLFFSSLMIYFNTKERWHSWQTLFYINLLLFNIMAISVISMGNFNQSYSLVFLFKDIVKFIINKCREKKITAKTPNLSIVNFNNTPSVNVRFP